MSQIHPTAVVDSAAELADDVVVGPGCVVDGPARIGAGTRLLGGVYLNGRVALGRGNTLYPHVCVGYAPQDRKVDHTYDGPGVALGDHNVLREGVTIHRATGERPTTLGDRNYLMANAHIGHDGQLGYDITLANCVGLGGHVSMGDGVIVGGNAGIHQFCRVGRLAIISGLVGVTQDVPPFCAAYEMRHVGSLNLVGLRRAGLREHIRPLKHAFDLLYRTGHSNERAIELIEAECGDNPLCRELAEFVRSSRRGICDYKPSRESPTTDA